MANGEITTMPYPAKSPVLRRSLARRDICPECGGALDTGWECNSCGFDAQDLAYPPPMDVKMTSNVSRVGYQQGFAAGIKAADNAGEFLHQLWGSEYGRSAIESYRETIRALRPAETAETEWLDAPDGDPQEKPQKVPLNEWPAGAPQTFEAGPDECDTGVALTKAIDAVLTEDDAVTYDPMGAVMTSEYPEPPPDDRPTEANIRGAEMLKRLYPEPPPAEPSEDAYERIEADVGTVLCEAGAFGDYCKYVFATCSEFQICRCRETAQAVMALLQRGKK